jgi:hypothetical protein
MFFQPISVSFTDLTTWSRNAAFNWTGMFSSNKIRNATQP